MFVNLNVNIIQPLLAFFLTKTCTKVNGRHSLISGVCLETV